MVKNSCSIKLRKTEGDNRLVSFAVVFNDAFKIACTYAQQIVN